MKHQDDEIDAIVEEAKKLLLQATYVELPKGFTDGHMTCWMLSDEKPKFGNWNIELEH